MPLLSLERVRGSMPDLSKRAIEQCSGCNPGLRAAGLPPMSFQQALALQRYLYEAERCDQLTPYNLVHYALSRVVIDEQHPKHPAWRHA
jgi:hypothetical protein